MHGEAAGLEQAQKPSHLLQTPLPRLHSRPLAPQLSKDVLEGSDGENAVATPKSVEMTTKRLELASANCHLCRRLNLGQAFVHRRERCGLRSFAFVSFGAFTVSLFSKLAVRAAIPYLVLCVAAAVVDAFVAQLGRFQIEWRRCRRRQRRPQQR